MIRCRLVACLVATVTFLSTSLPLRAAEITLKSLLAEMVDYDAIARWPAPEYVSKQASSYDRARVAPDKPGWFENNDHSNYVRTETNQGRRENVMMEADGPGAIVRMQVTNGDLRPGRVRIYLDGAAEPAIEWSTDPIPNEVFPVGPPLLAPNPPPGGHAAYSLYLPIPFANHCKMTLEESETKSAARYYHVNYRVYTTGTVVQTYSRATLDAARDEIARVAQLLENAPSRATAKRLELDTTLAPGTETSVDLPEGSHAIQQLMLSIGTDLAPAVREQALRSAVLRATFDDEQDAIWCPVGDFIGSGTGGHALKSWYRTVDERGHSFSRWTMPYRTRARFTLTNLGKFPVNAKLVADVGDWSWDDRSMHFHCSWKQQTKIPARPFRDWNFVSVTGKGVLVGDVMSVFNPLPSWYGEGDEKIWVDGESFPSHLGTGTEDYYNASWAPNPLYQTPFASQVRIDQPASQGHNVYTRSRNLDAIPFKKSLQFDFEIMTWKDSQVDYATTAYWYGSPGATSNVKPQPDEAQRPVPTLPVPRVIQGAVECETLAVTNKSDRLVVEPQDMQWAKGDWSAHAHLIAKCHHVGDFIEIAIPAEGTAPRRLTLYATRANDYGILRFSVNAIPVSDADFDGYAPDPAPSDPIPLGVFEPRDGKFILRAEVVGTNGKSIGDRYYLAMDAVVVSEK